MRLLGVGFIKVLVGKFIRIHEIFLKLPELFVELICYAFRAEYVFVLLILVVLYDLDSLGYRHSVMKARVMANRKNFG